MVWPMSGTGDHLAETLRSAANATHSVSGGATDVVDGYLRWAADQIRMLQGMLSPSDLDRLINELRADHKVSVLLIEHDMSLVMGISDEILVMEYGRPIATGDPAAIRAEYLKNFNAFLREITAETGRLSVEYHQMLTSRPPADALAALAGGARVTNTTRSA